MSAMPTEGGAVSPASHSVAPPSGLPAISPTRGEISQSPVGARATPLARRLAREAGIVLSNIAGTGPYGRVVKADIDAAIGNATPRVAAEAPAVASAAAPKAMSDDQVLKLFAEGSYELVSHDSMRKTIARRLVEAKSTIPHFYLTLDCELDALLALRTQLNAAAPVKKTEKGEVPAYKLSVNDLVIKAMAMALMAVPDANASWTDSAMV
ncbi:pyruvate dehydrogenase complex dihydrolipoamide acetyltransferase, partial [Mesorhizobium sp. M4B.F.Ca.ET.019.03.1.1]